MDICATLYVGLERKASLEQEEVTMNNLFAFDPRDICTLHYPLPSPALSSWQDLAGYICRSLDVSSFGIFL